MQYFNKRKLALWKKKTLFPFSHKGNLQFRPENGVCFKEMTD